MKIKNIFKKLKRNKIKTQCFIGGHAEGDYNPSFECSHVEGHNDESSKESCHAEGDYNENDSFQEPNYWITHKYEDYHNSPCCNFKLILKGQVNEYQTFMCLKCGKLFTLNTFIGEIKLKEN